MQHASPSSSGQGRPRSTRACRTGWRRSKLPAYLDRQLKIPTTVRNWNTVTKPSTAVSPGSSVTPRRSRSRISTTHLSREPGLLLCEEGGGPQAMTPSPTCSDLKLGLPGRPSDEALSTSVTKLVDHRGADLPQGRRRLRSLGTRRRIRLGWITVRHEQPLVAPQRGRRGRSRRAA